MTASKNPATVTDINAATGRKRSQSRASKNAQRDAATTPPADETPATDPQAAAALLLASDAPASDDASTSETDPVTNMVDQAIADAAPEITDPLTVLLIDGDFEIHKTGCRDIKRARKAGKIANEFGLAGEWSDAEAIAAELWADQIAEAGDDADLASYVNATNVRPCTGIGRKATASTTTRTLDADAAKARAELLDERAKAADAAEGKLAIPAGYVIHWAYPAGHSRLSRTDAAPEGSPKWLARCDEHGTTKPAAGAKEARSLGSRTNRVEWCKPCKTAAAKKERAAASTSASDAPATSDASATSSTTDASASDAK